MARENHAAVPTNGTALVRDRLLTALHVGLLQPGDRVLSVRRLAEMTGVNHKTVHRAYTELAREGFLEVRPGSGTFVTDRRSGGAGLPPVPELVRALRRVRREARRLGLEPDQMSRFLGLCLGGGLHGVPVGVVECNQEQIAMIGRDLHATLGVTIRPILLRALRHRPDSLPDGLRTVVTTDCHYSQVVNSIGEHDVAIHTVALDTTFPRYVSRLVRQNPLVMVVRDPGFGRIFTRLLGQLTTDPGPADRIRFVGERWAPATLRLASAGTRVYFSPLVNRRLLDAVPGHVRRIRRCWHVDPDTLESLRAGLSMGLALGA